MEEGGKIIYKDLSYRIMGVIFDVYNELGYGYQEKYYQKAIGIALEQERLTYKANVHIRFIIKVKKSVKIMLIF